MPDSLGHYVRMFFQFDPKSKLASLRLKNQLGATDVAFYCFADAFHPSAPSAPRSRIRTKLAVGLDQVLVVGTSAIVREPKKAFKIGYLPTTSVSEVQIPRNTVFTAPFTGEMQPAPADSGAYWISEKTDRTEKSILSDVFFLKQRN